MSKNFYISDTHFFHKNVTAEAGERQFDGRPFQTLDEMHTVMKERWNNVVTNADHVWICGDLTWKENEEAIAFISTLKGNKHLILGNHCKAKDQRFRQLFVEITDYKEIQDTVDGKQYRVILSHFPIYAWNHQHRGAIHLYGHVHNSQDEIMYQKALTELNKYYAQRDGDRYTPFKAYNVGCMHWNYEPVTLKEIIDANRKDN